jgi:hypothetical protein
MDFLSSQADKHDESVRRRVKRRMAKRRRVKRRMAWMPFKMNSIDEFEKL